MKTSNQTRGIKNTLFCSLSRAPDLQTDAGKILNNRAEHINLLLSTWICAENKVEVPEDPQPRGFKPTWILKPYIKLRSLEQLEQQSLSLDTPRLMTLPVCLPHLCCRGGHTSQPCGYSFSDRTYDTSLRKLIREKTLASYRSGFVSETIKLQGDVNRPKYYWKARGIASQTWMLFWLESCILGCTFPAEQPQLCSAMNQLRAKFPLIMPWMSGGSQRPRYEKSWQCRTKSLVYMACYWSRHWLPWCRTVMIIATQMRSAQV